MAPVSRPDARFDAGRRPRVAAACLRRANGRSNRRGRRAQLLASARAGEAASSRAASIASAASLA
ncbi:hypothetical protein BURPS668_A2781 [Burkholderia pseudomallei 668]|nr:hypothetical protein BURPS668_A2781 [Burkholderia pseudomallei 668]EDO89280.1 hypothetical protein BURPSPAST_AC0282 [Burkholderia pseudomallei Pasteur 52237]